MQKINFDKFEFIINEEKILLTKAGFFTSNGWDFVDVTVLGENKNSSLGNKIDSSSEGPNFKYVSHEITSNKLSIIIESNNVRSNIVINKLDEDSYIISNEITNITENSLYIEEASTFKITGLENIDLDDVYFTSFMQSHHYECLPNRINLNCLKYNNGRPQRMVSHTNTGSWSTKEALPQGILEYNNEFLMFNIVNNSCWHYEISPKWSNLYLACGYPTLSNSGFTKVLEKGESFKLLDVAFSFGSSLEDCVNAMNVVRRSFYNPSISDKSLPTIFNEYMHLSWDSPLEERTLEMAKLVANLGVKYYVIDCGWHNEEPGDKIYPYVGQWIQSKARFPHGIKYIKEELEKLGLKLGLWIEPEIIGYKCQDMLSYYDDDCFLRRNGKRIFVMNRYFLDYRNKKVYDYMSNTIKRMVEDYGASYIKFDYNQDIGLGCDDPSSFVLGYKNANDAFVAFVEENKKKYPEVIFEGCSSGGMRMDARSVGLYSLVSTSDQTNYLKYPYIVGNVFNAVIPEQAAVWSYPVDSHIEGFEATKEFVEKNISKSQVVINMVNGLLGRMHLASHLELLDEEKLSLVKEGIKYYDTIAKEKIGSKVVMPKGFSHFEDDFVTVGFQKENKVYLGVWAIKNNKKINITLNEKIKDVKVGYPSTFVGGYSYKNNHLIIGFLEAPNACILEIEL